VPSPGRLPGRTRRRLPFPLGGIIQGREVEARGRTGGLGGRVADVPWGLTTLHDLVSVAAGAKHRGCVLRRFLNKKIPSHNAETGCISLSQEGNAG